MGKEARNPGLIPKFAEPGAISARPFTEAALSFPRIKQPEPKKHLKLERNCYFVPGLSKGGN